MRTFLAIPFDDEVRRQTGRLIEKLRRESGRVRWTAEANIHLTLLFYGDVEDRLVPELADRVVEVAAGLPAFELALRGLGGFPNVDRPRVVWLGVGEGSAETSRLHARLVDATGEYLQRREDRAFTPHVTIGRFARGARPSGGLREQLGKQADWAGPTAAVEALHLFRSDLSPSGPRYTVLATCPLRRG